MPNNTGVIGHYLSGYSANEAALELAKSCRGDGEVVMLVGQVSIPDPTSPFKLNTECYIGQWERGGMVPIDSVCLMYEKQAHLVRNARGTLEELSVGGCS